MQERTREKMRAFAARLIDQHKARILVPPYEDACGFWFGGGNLIEDRDGQIYLVGRYRNHGDSRTGLEKGARGLELVIFQSSDRGRTFQPMVTFTKDDLSPAGYQVLSIEGAAFCRTYTGVELYVSSEKAGISYPKCVTSFQKPGTGVWSIDRLTAKNVRGLRDASLQPFLSTDRPEYLHIKDPVIHRTAAGETVLFFCHHPFNWASSNSGCCVRKSGGAHFSTPDFNFFPRGTTWDAAAGRITDVLTLPGELMESDMPVQAAFYDGAECMRPLDPDPMAVERPRGYSCEELGGLAAYPADRTDAIERITTVFPLFVSPWGTGSARYIHTLSTKEGVFATWQQSHPSGAQPLVMNFLSWKEIREAASSFTNWPEAWV